ncbi:MAG: helix-turn-helix domain-containing protein [Deltaproteobacteria bacterium]|nr:helix-turn-helix domain-containing protein [Deltaproteobacteria bacterium]
MPSTWKSWVELPERDRRTAIADAGFWSQLSEEQRQVFLDTADWQELRLVPEAKAAKLGALVSLDAICKHLGLTEVEVYWLMSTRKLPSFIVGPVWKFDTKSVDAWVTQMGGRDAVHKDIKEQMARHRAGKGGDAAKA